MKPGSSARCTAKWRHLRCHLRKGHDGRHQAPQYDATTRWDDDDYAISGQRAWTEAGNV